MGAVRCILDETNHRFVQAGGWMPLTIAGTRRIQATPLRYCLQGDMLYLPKDVDPDSITFQRRYSWARLRVDVIEELDFKFSFNTPIPSEYGIDYLEDAGVGIGSRYMKRHREINGERTPVSSFCADELIRKLQENPEALSSVSRKDFESLCAELFVSRGFEVDLYRVSKDDGIDFLALKTDREDPLIFAVQCKHPDHIRSDGKKARGLPPATVREIYGVAKAMNISGGIAITSAHYSNKAKQFADSKPDEIFVYDRKDVLAWIEKYRWNENEK